MCCDKGIHFRILIGSTGHLQNQHFKNNYSVEMRVLQTLISPSVDKLVINTFVRYIQLLSSETFNSIILWSALDLSEELHLKQLLLFIHAFNKLMYTILKL